MSETIWLRFPPKGYMPMHAMVLSNQLDPYAAPGGPALLGGRVINLNRNPHTIRDCDAMIKRGILTWLPTPGYVWTQVGRALAVSMRKAHQQFVPTPSHPLPDHTGVRLFDLLEWIDDQTRTYLMNLPITPEIENPYWARIMSDLGVVSIRQHSNKMVLNVPTAAVLEFFRRTPRCLPDPAGLVIPIQARGPDREELQSLHYHLRQMKRIYDTTGPTEDDWDIL